MFFTKQLCCAALKSLLAIGVACSVLVPLAAGATCPSLSAARKAWSKVDYTATQKAIDDCLEYEGNPREVLIELYEMQGIMAASRRQMDVARDAFRRVFTIDPKHQPADLSPRIATPYLEAQSQVASEGALELTRESARFNDEAVTVILAVKGNSLKLATSVRLHARADGGRWQKLDTPVAAPRFVVRGRKVEWWAELLGANVAQLELLGSAAQPHVEEAPSLVPPDSPPPPVPLVEAPAPASGSLSNARLAGIILGGAGIVALAVGIVFGIFSQQQRAEFATTDPNGGITRQKALDLQSQAISDAVLANVLMISGGALIAGGLLLEILNPGGAAEVALVPSRSGLALSGRWP
jgi:hypothetical protein